MLMIVAEHKVYTNEKIACCSRL